MNEKREASLDDVMETLAHIMNFSEKSFQRIHEDIQGIKRKLDKLDDAIEIIELRKEKEKDLSYMKFSELEQRIRAVELKVTA